MFCLYIEALAAKHVSAVITVIGICSLYIAYYSDTKEQYFQAGNVLTELLDKLRILLVQCKSSGSSLQRMKQRWTKSPRISEQPARESISFSPVG
ncbi:hypothetical protein AAHB60_07980 [Pseudomonas aeruginosa]